MGELAFGKSFDMLKTGKTHHVIDMFKDGMTLLGLVTPAPWLARLGFSVPGVASGWKSMFRWSDRQMQERLERHTTRKDIASWLIDAMPHDHATVNSRDWLNGDAFGTIIAGSDTTASTLV